jgi:hypothetical protein
VCSSDLSDKDSCTEASDGAAEQNPVEQRTGETPQIGVEHFSSCSQTSENLEELAEKVGTLGLRVAKKNRGAARKRARKARLAEAPSGTSDGGRTWSAPGEQPSTSQEPVASGAQHGRGPAPPTQKSPESGGQPQDPGKRQRPVGAPGGRSG